MTKFKIGTGIRAARDPENDESDAVWIKGMAEQHGVGSTDVPSISTAGGDRNALWTTCPMYHLKILLPEPRSWAELIGI